MAKHLYYVVGEDFAAVCLIPLLPPPCSQVAGLQTEAVLDLSSDEWVIHTPDEGAIKWWIGNAAEDGRAATVFARLKVPSQEGE
jgi:alkylation response protein AidB-like acyl-CoA dehydrogenase